VAKKINKKKQWLVSTALVIFVALSGGAVWYWFYANSTKKSSGKKNTQTAVDHLADSDISAEDSEVAVAQEVLTNVSLTMPTKKVYDHCFAQEGNILLATTIPKTGELGFLGRALSDGLFLYLNKTNTLDGGVWGANRLSLDQRDDNGTISHALPLVYDLLTKTPVFFSVTGEIVFEKIYIPLLAAASVAVLFPVIGMRIGITSAMPVVWYRPSYGQEIAALLDYAINTLKLNQIAVFYEESTWGVEAKNTTEYLLRKKYNLNLFGAASYQPGTVTIQSAVTELKKIGPQVVLCLSNGRPTYNFIREAINQQLHYVTFLGLSRVSSIVAQLKKSRGIELITSSVVPNPFKSQLPIVQEYRKYMQQYLPNKGLSVDTLEGYIATALFVYFLKQVPATATVKDLLDCIAQTETLIFKGLTLTYKEKTLSWSVWLNKGSDVEWDEYRNEH
jgi:branched-chain amino acid transport system substrate-binding protein